MAEQYANTTDGRLKALEEQSATDHDLIGDLRADVSYLLLNQRTAEKVSAAGPITRGVTLVTTANADKAMTLPAAASIDVVYDFIVVKVDAAGSGKVVLTPDGTDTIDGSATLSSPASAVALAHLISDGTSGWRTVALVGTWT